MPKKPAPVINGCEGIFPDYRKKGFQAKINAFVLNASIPVTAMYKSGVGAINKTNMFHKNCTDSGVYRWTKIGNLHSCDACHVDFYVSLGMYVSVLNCSNPIIAFLYSDEWSKGEVFEAEHV
jgi:hypothetical protein